MMVKETTFIQVINGVRYKVKMPENRVDTVIARADKWIEQNKFKLAHDTIKPFLVD